MPDNEETRMTIDNKEVTTPLKYLGKVLSFLVSFAGIQLLVGGSSLGILFLLLGIVALWYFTRELKSSRLSRWMLDQRLKIWRKINTQRRQG